MIQCVRVNDGCDDGCDSVLVVDDDVQSKPDSVVGVLVWNLNNIK